MASINGKILRATDHIKRPVAGMPVAIQRASTEHCDIAAKSDRNGQYRFDGLEPGTYTIGADDTSAVAKITGAEDSIECDIVLDALSKETTLQATQVETTEADRDVQEAFDDDPYGRDTAPSRGAREESGSLSLIDKGLVYASLSLRLAAGQRDRNKLTDVAYGVLHPDEPLPFSTDDPDFEQLSAEWLSVRRTIVDVLLDGDDTSPSGGSQPSASTITPFGLEFQRMPDGESHRVRRNAVNWAIPEVIDAVGAIAREWHRRHPEVKLWILDMSRRQGGLIFPPHRSHAVGCDVDMQLRLGREKLCMRHNRYPEWRSLWQELCDIARSNGVLPTKRIGFTDPLVSNVSHWPGHVCHVHVRFCAPPSKIRSVEAAVAGLYSDKPRNKRPNYRGASALFEAAPVQSSEAEAVLFPTDYLDEEAGSLESASQEIGLIKSGFAYAAIAVAYARGVRAVDDLTDEGWQAIFPEAPFPLQTNHDGFARKRRIWLEVREMVRGFLDRLTHGSLPAPQIASTCQFRGRDELRRLAEAAEAAGAPPGFAIFAEAAAWTESRWNNCAINSSAGEALAARRLFNGARSRGWFPETPHKPDEFGFGSGGWFGMMPSTGLIAGGNRGPFINAHPRLVTDPAASVTMLADFVVRVRRKYKTPDWLASRRAMAALALHGDTAEELRRSVQTRLRFEEGLQRAGIDDPLAFMRQRPDPSGYPGAWELWMQLDAISLR